VGQGSALICPVPCLDAPQAVEPRRRPRVRDPGRPRSPGSDPLPRAEVVSKVWDYIKRNKLQDPQNKREIMADDKLQAVFGKNRVTMFEMNKYLAQHLK
jgi:hypothetical protein